MLLVEGYERSRYAYVSISHIFTEHSNIRQSEIPPLFVESWIYSSALSAVEQCDTWSSSVDLDAKRPAFNAGKAELLELARNQVCTSHV